MRLLLDTHALVWWINNIPKLSANAYAAIGAADNNVYVSVCSAWEIAIKVGLGKWPEAVTLLGEFDEAIATEGFAMLPITISHVRTAGLMQSPHRDPFDRLLAAQAMIEGLTFVSADVRIKGLGAECLW